MATNEGHETYTYTLPSGATIEVENLAGSRRGAVDASPGRGKDEPLPIQQVLAPLGELVDVVFGHLKLAVRKPDKVTLELGAAFKGKTGLVIVSGEAQANLKVTLSWEKPAKKPARSWDGRRR